MRARFEFTFHHVEGANLHAHGDVQLALLGSLGWEIRAMTAAASGDGVILSLQRPLDEELPLPDAPTLVATLEEALPMPSVAELEER